MSEKEEKRSTKKIDRNHNPNYKQNLVQYSDKYTEEERKALWRKGAEKTNAIKKEKASMKKSLDAILNMTIKKGKAQDLAEIDSLEELEDKNVTVRDLILCKQIRQALEGDVKSFEQIRKIDCDINIGGSDSQDKVGVEQFINALSGQVGNVWIENEVDSTGADE